MKLVRNLPTLRSVLLSLLHTDFPTLKEELGNNASLVINKMRKKETKTKARVKHDQATRLKAANNGTECKATKIYGLAPASALAQR